MNPIHNITPLAIYNTLSTGATVQLDFTTKKAAQDFRQSISVIKSRTEKNLAGCGIDLDSSQLTMTYDHEAGLATFVIKQVKYLHEFKILNILPPTQTPSP